MLRISKSEQLLPQYPPAAFKQALHRGRETQSTPTIHSNQLTIQLRDKQAIQESQFTDIRTHQNTQRQCSKLRK